MEVDPWHYMNKRRFIVPNFTGGPDTAPAYALDATTFFSAENAEEIAAALGLVGEASSAPNTRSSGALVTLTYSRYKRA